MLLIAHQQGHTATASEVEPAGSAPSGPAGSYGGRQRTRQSLQADGPIREWLAPRATERADWQTFAIAHPPVRIGPRPSFVAGVLSDAGMGLLPYALMPEAYEDDGYMEDAYAVGQGKRVYDQERGLRRLYDLAEDLFIEKGDNRMLMALRKRGVRR